jgi:hypothetical protein
LKNGCYFVRSASAAAANVQQLPVDLLLGGIYLPLFVLHGGRKILRARFTVSDERLQRCRQGSTAEHSAQKQNHHDYLHLHVSSSASLHWPVVIRSPACAMIDIRTKATLHLLPIAAVPELLTFVQIAAIFD